MSVSPDEARSALEAIREIEERTRRSIRLAGGGPILMIWGVVWLLGYVGGHFAENGQQGALWAVLNLAGLVATMVVVSRLSQRVRNPIGPRLGLLWMFLMLYGVLWIWIAQPDDPTRIGFMAATIAMFGYVVLGLWLDTIFLWIGLVVTALSVALYVLMPDAFSLGMGVLGGGALFGSGSYIHRRWR